MPISSREYNIGCLDETSHPEQSFKDYLHELKWDKCSSMQTEDRIEDMENIKLLKKRSLFRSFSNNKNEFFRGEQIGSKNTYY
jgi:hypothetical protein